MRVHTWLGLTLLALLFAAGPGSGASAGSPPDTPPPAPSPETEAAFVPGRVLVRLYAWASPEAASRLAGRHAYQLRDRLSPLNLYLYAVPEGAEREALATLEREPEVQWARLEAVNQSMLVPNDSLYSSLQWNLRHIGMEAAWDITRGDSKVVVAVLDTGVDLTHPDLAPNLVPGYDFVHDDPLPEDDSSHGTHTAGIIAALGNNDQGIAGIAWNVKIMPIKVLDANGLGPESALIKGLIYAVDQGARILNVSSGTTTNSPAMAEAVAYAHEKGALIISAAGNSGNESNNAVFPAAYPEVLAVGAVDRSSRAAPFSQRQDYVRVVAPGVDIPSSAWRGAGIGQYALATGTSAAAPHVAGLAALLWSLDPDLTSDEVAQLIADHAEDLEPPGRDPATGYGLINAARTLAALRPGPVPPTLPPATVGPTVTPPSLPTLAPLPAPAPLPRAPSDWYFAEGTTKSPFHTWLHILNPNAETTEVTVDYLLTDGQVRTQVVQVPAQARTSVLVNQVLPDAEFSMHVHAPSTVFVERAMFFGHDGHITAGVAAPSPTWHFAEGATLAPVDTWLLLQNPNPSPVNVRLIFATNEGSQREHLQSLPPHARRTVYVNQLLLSDGFSTSVAADAPVIAERAMYFDRGQSGHVAVGAKAPAKTWYLAEGSTQPGFATYLSLHNPNEQPARAQIRFIREDGDPREVEMMVAPHGRTRFSVASMLPNASFGAVIEATVPIIVERTMTFGGAAGGTHVGSGAFVPSQEWYLAEGSTKSPFSEYLALLNPNKSSADIELSLLPSGGGNPLVFLLQVQPERRLLLDVNRLAPDVDAAVRVRSSKPVVVERSMYLANGTGGTSAAGQSR